MTSVFDRLIHRDLLDHKDYVTLLKETPLEHLLNEANRVRHNVFGNQVYIRGLIEISNICTNDCYYCGIRKSTVTDRYRLSAQEIINCSDIGYELGFRTFVMQGGEDPALTDEFLSPLIQQIKSSYPDSAITLSLGERKEKSYQKLFDAGADRYLLRHETANPIHYKKLHPHDMDWSHRMQCLATLYHIGFQTGCGVMVGSPYQTVEDLATDLQFIRSFRPHMVGIGPFIPHAQTPFKKWPSGTVEQTLRMLAIVRILLPPVLLPTTTALSTLDPNGRNLGLQAGANVIMPNLSPVTVREKYNLYDGKVHSGEEAAEAIRQLKKQVASIGYDIVTDRGDFPENYKEYV